jgi:hypothetical protein
MDTQSNNRKWMWVAIIIVAVLYFTPQVMQSFREAAFYRQQALNAQAQSNRALPSGAVSPAPTIVPGNPVPPTARPAPSQMVGTFQGQQMQAGHQVCNLVLEMREGAPGVLGGYAKLTCYPVAIPGQSGYKAQNIARYLSPSAAVLSGHVENGVVAFRIDKTIGATPEGCVLSAFTVSSFGNDQVAAQWEIGACGKGQIIAQRMGR